MNAGVEFLNTNTDVLTRSINLQRYLNAVQLFIFSFFWEGLRGEYSISTEMKTLAYYYYYFAYATHLEAFKWEVKVDIIHYTFMASVYAYSISYI